MSLMSHDHSLKSHDQSAGITGNPNVGFGAAELEGDFDPASYDQAMARAFDDEYYVMEEEGREEEEEGENEGKPVFSDDEDGGMSLLSLLSLLSQPSTFYSSLTCPSPSLPFLSPSSLCLEYHHLYRNVWDLGPVEHTAL